MRHIIIVTAAAVALTIGLPILAWAQVKPAEVPKEAHDEAERYLPVVRKMVTAETYRRLGFESVEEASRASLEKPMRVLMVRLDRLREYRPETRIAEMFEDTDEVRYPISVDGQVRASVVMRRIDGKWQVAKFGRPMLTRALTAAIRKHMAETQAPAGAFFEVEIPALNLDFAGRDAGNRILLTTTAEDSRFGLKPDEEIDAQELFARIAPYARDLKTGPRLSD